MQLGPDLPGLFAARMGQLLGPNFPTDIGLAVSGGGDSMAMLHLAAPWARVYGINVSVVTIDHGLRAESAAEAAMVADEANGLGLTHDVLTWQGWSGDGNLQDAARRARRDLIGSWRRQVAHVLFAHTMDDQAETLLMRLARGSGVDGLAAMADVAPVPGGWQIIRPLLEMRRADLRHFVTTLNIPYVDDPSNDDEGFARVRIRRLIGQEGLDVATLAETARHMARARDGLTAQVAEAAKRLVTGDTCAQGFLRFDRDGFAKIPHEIQLRLLKQALKFIGGADYPPRLKALESARDRVVSGGKVTLQGCILKADPDALMIIREPEAVAGLQDAICNGAALWDGRWKISGPSGAFTLRALGDSLSTCPDWRNTGLPRDVLATSPSIWLDDRLIAAPLAGFGTGWHAQIATDFHSALLTH